jgi:hypothetical protein
VARLRAVGNQETVERPADGLGQLRLEPVKGLLVPALARPANQAEETVHRWPLDPLSRSG